MSGDAYVFQMATPVDAPTAKAIARDPAALPEVAYAQPGATRQHMGIRVAGSPRRGQVADDPAFADQWHYRYTPGSEEGINVPPAWNITTGSADIVVAVIDTGILPPPDLAGRTVPGYDFITSPQQTQRQRSPERNNSRTRIRLTPAIGRNRATAQANIIQFVAWHTGQDHRRGVQQQQQRGQD